MILVYLINFLLATTTTISMTLIPLLATDSIGMSMLLFGIIEGTTEFMSMVFRFVSGNLFDHIKNRKMLFVTPVFISLLSKTVLFFPSFTTIFSSKMLERISNGLFASPRDAFIGEHAKNKGIALAILSCSKTLGCVLGPLSVTLYVYYFGSFDKRPDNIYILIGIASIISLSTLTLSFFIDGARVNFTLKKQQFNLQEIKIVYDKLWPIFILSFLFFLGRFNDGVIMLYLKNQGFSEKIYLNTIAIFNMCMFLASPLMGYIIDKGMDKIMLFVTIIALLLFNILFYNVNVAPLLFGFAGLLAWGIQRAGAQITFTAMIFKNTPIELYGTSIGLFGVISGLGTLLSSMICGHLASFSFQYIFLISGVSSCITIISAIIAIKTKRI